MNHPSDSIHQAHSSDRGRSRIAPARPLAPSLPSRPRDRDAVALRIQFAIVMVLTVFLLVVIVLD